MFSSYIRKPKPVLAVLVTEENRKDVGDHMHRSNSNLMGWPRIGEWVVEHPFGRYETYSQKDFQEVFHKTTQN